MTSHKIGLKSFLLTVKLHDDGPCPCSRTAETVEHVIKRCTKHSDLRMEVFTAQIPPTKKPSTTNSLAVQAAKFMHATKRLCQLDPVPIAIHKLRSTDSPEPPPAGTKPSTSQYAEHTQLRRTHSTETGRINNISTEIGASIPEILLTPSTQHCNSSPRPEAAPSLGEKVVWTTLT